MFLFRWRYIYSDGSTIFGMWSQHGEKKNNQAWYNNKSNMMYALIESKNIATKEIKVIAECSKDDFMNFQFIATAKVSISTNIKVQTPQQNIVGIKMLTRNTVVEFYQNGHTKVRKIYDSEKNINFETY